MTLVELDPQSSVSSVSCSVCGNTVHGKHYGVEACLGCTVFFRRAIYNKTVYICYKGGKCLITSGKPEMETDEHLRIAGKRKQCRHCRMQKCFDVGMKSEAVQYRDAIGPRLKFKKIKSLKIPDDMSYQSTGKPCWKVRAPENSIKIIRGLVLLQSKQQRTASTNLERTLSIGIENAKEWIKQLGTSSELFGYQHSEFTVGLILLDYRNECAEKDTLTENNRFHLGLLEELIREIDDFECACLKTLIFLNLSMSHHIHRKERDQLQNVCLIELFDYLLLKCPESAPVRFGEIILMLSSVRCGINEFFEQSEGSDIFHVITVDPYFRKFFLGC